MPVIVRGPAGTSALAAPLRAIVRATLAAEGLGVGEVAVLLAGDQELRRLNRDWRGIDRATDVLSFSYDEGAGPPLDPGRVHGDLAISLDRMREQAKRFRVRPGAELARLTIHG